MSKIEIYVKGVAAGTSVNSLQTKIEPISAQQASEKVDSKSDIALKNNQGTQGVVIASMLASRTLSYATSNVGKWTGNSRNQDRINKLQQAAGIGVTALVSPFLAVATVGVQVGTTAFEAYATNRLEEQRADARRLRAGYSSDDRVLGGRK